MSLTDIMSAARLSLYPQVALLFFVAVFVAVVVYVLLRPRSEMQRAARLPLEDDVPTAAPTGAPATRGTDHE